MRKEQRLGPWNKSPRASVRSIYIIVALLLFFVAGCTSAKHPNLFETADYRVSVDVVEGCTLLPMAYEEKGRFIVAGRMSYRHHKNWPLSGDVRVEVLSPGGALLETKSVPFTPHPHSRHIHPSASFEIPLSYKPPKGSEIKIRHTLRPSDGDERDPVIR